MYEGHLVCGGERLRDQYMECLNDVKGEWESVFQPIPLIHSDPLFATSGVDLYALGESQASLTVSQQHTRLQGDNSVWLLTEKITMSKCFKMSLLLREKKRRTAFSFQHVVWSFVCAFNFILNIFFAMSTFRVCETAPAFAGGEAEFACGHFSNFFGKMQYRVVQKNVLTCIYSQPCVSEILALFFRRCRQSV